MIINEINSLKNKLITREAFTLAEMMVVLMILSLVLAAFMPVITKRSKVSGSSAGIWKYASNNSDIYFGTSLSTQGMALGMSNLDGKNTRLLLNSASADQVPITFYQAGTETGKLIVTGTTAGSTYGAYDVGLGNVTLEGSPIMGGNTAIGYGVNASDSVSKGGNTAMGWGSAASGGYSTAIGRGALADGQNSVSIGYASWANTHSESTSVGYNAQSTGNSSTALGYKSIAAANSIAVGYFAQATGAEATAVGYQAQASADISTAVGAQSNAHTRTSSAFGFLSSATGNYSTNIGANGNPSCGALADYALAVGSNVIANASYSVAIGYTAQATGYASVGIGYNAQALGTGATVLGTSANASNTDSSAIGDNSKASSQQATAVGGYAQAIGDHSIALGVLANASGSYAVAIGAGATAAANQIMLGTGQNVYIPGSLTVVGTTTGPSQYWTTSDKRLKNVNGEFTGGLDKIRQIKPYNFTMKKDKSKTPQVSVMAQDLKKVFPDAVRKGDDGYLTIRQNDMFYAMVNSIKQLDKIVQGVIKDLKALVVKVEQIENQIMDLAKIDKAQNQRIKTLEAKNKALEKRIAKLEKAVNK